VSLLVAASRTIEVRLMAPSDVEADHDDLNVSIELRAAYVDRPTNVTVPVPNPSRARVP
jgi:hypothetical protein